ncbi:hypothetical protein PR202_ga23806 [Eleusine coracana subsp. coracana]|uniref:Uncharacterized protein n=1 Tax=Eleusine coracana subsp. coracana TaxID=191504 RepID=A0AAV5D7I3_ELECO|nr:hypothetical protein PR202_ga23806 [Eleusine coracana subsp. coracana]
MMTRRAEGHLVDALGDGGVPLAGVGPDPLDDLLIRVRRREEEEGEGGGVRAHVAGHEADVGVGVGAVAADGVLRHRRARGPHLVVEIQRKRAAAAAVIYQ